MVTGVDVSPRTITLTLAGGLALSVLGGYTYLVKPRWAEYKTLQQEHRESVATLQLDASTLEDSGIKDLETEVDELTKKLYGVESDEPVSQVAANIIGQLGQLSTRHRVTLSAVKPGGSTQVLEFTETPFDIEVEGPYRELVDWLESAEDKLRPLVVKQFSISKGNEAEERLRMLLRVVSYRRDSRS